MLISNFEQSDFLEEKSNEIKNFDFNDDNNLKSIDKVFTFENENATKKATKKYEIEEVKINIIHGEEKVINKKRKRNETDEKIFNTDKKVIKGRPKKDIGYKGKHGKNCPDNLIIKIKRFFFNNYIIEFINNKYIKYLAKNNVKTSRSLLKPISQTYIKDLDPKRNIEFFNKTLKEIYSVDISKKFKISPKYNKNNIDELYKDNNAKEIIDILNKTVKEMYNNFIKTNEVGDFGNLELFLENINKKMKNKKEEEIINHKILLKHMAKNLENFFIIKCTRKMNSKKDLNN